jgi:hypothetical protein
MQSVKIYQVILEQLRFVFRRDGIDPAGCKHVKACRATGLI